MTVTQDFRFIDEASIAISHILGEDVSYVEYDPIPKS